MPRGATEGYLLDTNIATPAWDGGHERHFAVRERLAGLPTDLVFVSVVSVGEVEYGLSASPAIDAARHEQMRRAMNDYTLLELDRHTAATYGGIKAKLFLRYAPRGRRRGIGTKYVEDLSELATGKELGIQENDLWIVSAAKTHNLIFVTRDRRGGMPRVVEVAEYSERTEYWD